MRPLGPTGRVRWLTRAVHPGAAPEALGDDKHRLIKTVSRRGYRLDAAISTDEVPPARSPATLLCNVGSSFDAVPEPVAEKIDLGGLEGERKHVTVLCANLRQSLEAIADHDPEKALKVFDKVLQLMTDVVHRYEGTMNVVTTDGVMALFGAPLAHEDHAVRACYAALEIQERVNQFAQEQREFGNPIRVSAGLNSGEVIVRPTGSDVCRQYAVMGRTTHLAVRLEQIATSGALLVSAETLRLAEGHVHVTTPSPRKAVALPSLRTSLLVRTGRGHVSKPWRRAG